MTEPTTDELRERLAQESYPRPIHSRVGDVDPRSREQMLADLEASAGQYAAPLGGPVYVKQGTSREVVRYDPDGRTSVTYDPDQER
jgi:hypothetical protein